MTVTPDPFYDDGDVTIYHAPCQDLLAAGIEADAIITDPPFGQWTHANAKTNAGGGGARQAIGFDSLDADRVRRLLGDLAHATRGWIVASLDWRHIAELDARPPAGLRLLRFGVWVKPNPMPQVSGDRPAQGWEGIAYLHRDDRRPTWHGGGHHGNFVLPTAHETAHPTEKPLEMLHTLVERFTEPGQTVFDPFCGSGTTLRAAKDLGRRAVGCELDERWGEGAAGRCRQDVLAW